MRTDFAFLTPRPSAPLKAPRASTLREPKPAPHFAGATLDAPTPLQADRLIAFESLLKQSGFPDLQTGYIFGSLLLMTGSRAKSEELIAFLKENLGKGPGENISGLTHEVKAGKDRFKLFGMSLIISAD